MTLKSRIAGATAILGVAGTLGLGIAPAASADAAQTVNVRVTVKGNYNATVCVTDILGGTCRDVNRGKSRVFTVQPRRGTAVSVRVIAKGGGSDEANVVTGGSSLRFDAVGSKSRPDVKRR
ncbi:hypothetical protein [Sinosporangium siamense]|uniref:Uncharacterized protein n=1 Tax=Sinosporangium siamense TaxID=1367973 RepID=A0A919RF27_9ACTN|nr:hypothetical protein [Sinosporangium siamense]GII91625.1 hypothetical protein Ssi02_18560 [Sinosporangium siamense]